MPLIWILTINATKDVVFVLVRLRINPNGTCIDKITNVPEQIDLSDSSKYFKEKLVKLYSYKAQVAKLSL
ncbi:hypothetical protein [Methanobrevibacter millerae]|uniref:Uncharacterized protein n=1 Tax=Methanobrevibacter millerae TaxID=230361 RepID=A0A0U2L7X5_9EURY|nr:hypothetical protein [Methanobrevibacter millerae]ALT70062.1 hypothetical protein sm9_2306 [Methanobrevibacter millerae]